VNNYYKPRGFGGFSLFPPVIKNLLIINGIVFFLQTLLSNLSFNGVPGWYIINRWFALNPFGGVDAAGQSYNFQIWQLITYQFMHGGFGHIFFNMFVLWMFGIEIENMWGSKKFLFFYLLCGVSAGFFHLFLSSVFGLPAAVTIGASGAIYGVMIAFALFFPDRLIYLYFFIPVKAKYLITFAVLLEIMLVDSAGSSIAHLAHLGGALVAFIFIMLDKDSYISLKRMLNWNFHLNDKNSPFSNMQNPFKKERSNIQEAKFYEFKDDTKGKKENITQEEIDRILDKISESGYQNLTEEEKKILFEASKKIN